MTEVVQKCAWCRREAVSGQTLCEQHREYLRTYRAADRAMRKSKGICAQCDEPAEPDRGRCIRHLQESAARSKLYFQESFKGERGRLAQLKAIHHWRQYQEFRERVAITVCSLPDDDMDDYLDEGSDPCIRDDESPDDWRLTMRSEGAHMANFRRSL